MSDPERLLALVREAYAALLGALPADRGHCYEISALARVIARAMGLETALCRGAYMRLPDLADQHGWLRVGDQILHSPARGQVELAPFDGTIFVERWRAGPPPLRGG